MEKIAQCTLESRNLEEFQKTGKSFNFSNCPKKRSQKQSNMFSTCLEVIFSAKIFAQCTLGGRNLQKIQKSGKTSKLSKFSKNVPKNIVWSCVAWLFRRKKTLPSAPWRLEKVPQKSKRIQIFKNVQKRFQDCPNMFWCDFFEIFRPVHPGG